MVKEACNYLVQALGGAYNPKYATLLPARLFFPGGGVYTGVFVLFQKVLRPHKLLSSRANPHLVSGVKSQKFLKVEQLLMR